jgi:hypothetical protein
VRADDWCPASWTPKIIELYRAGPSKCGKFRGDTVASRRRWYSSLHEGR